MIRTDIYFAGDDSHRFLPWLVGVMVCLAAILLNLGITVSGWIANQHTSYSSSFTVNLPASTENLERKLAEVNAKLKQTPGIASAVVMKESELLSLLSPWLGESSARGALPLPTVIDVTTAPNASIDYRILQKNLAEIAPGTELDAHEQWIATFASFASTAKWLLMSLAAVIVAAIAVMIAFTSRAALKLHGRTVQLLHAVGAEDNYIARQFQMDAFRMVLPAAFGGALLAVVLFFAISRYLASLPASILPAFSLNGEHAALLFFLPLSCGFLAWLVARVSVLRQLRRSL
jgi:cell division transport system permease protein